MLFIEAVNVIKLRSSGVVKPKARLCEPWVTSKESCRSREAATNPERAVAFIPTRKLRL